MPSRPSRQLPVPRPHTLALALLPLAVLAVVVVTGFWRTPRVAQEPAMDRPPAARSAETPSAAVTAPAPDRPVEHPQPTTSANRLPATDVLTVLDANREATGAIPGEYLARFASKTAMARFLRDAGRHGITIVDQEPRLRTVRFHTDDLDRAHAFLNNAEITDLDDNTEVTPPPEPDLTLAPPMVHYQPFGTQGPGWLGMTGGDPVRGQGVVVAVLDTGVDRHPALDESRVVRLELDGAPLPEDAGGTYHGHGTAVAAIIAGTSDQAPGMAPAATILAIRVLGDDGRGDSFTLARGIMAAVDQGASVINLSLGGYGDSHPLAAAVDYAVAHGAVVVAATGNDGQDQVLYPARYEEVIGVGGIDAAEQHLAFSNFGTGTDLVAPGFQVATAWSDNGYAQFSGTSAAAPFVSGAIAALLSGDPSLSPQEAAELLLAYANDTGAPGVDDRFGHGILNWERVHERLTPGRRDLAVAGYYLPEPSLPAEETTIPVVITLQNRGTEYLPATQVTVAVNGDQRLVEVPGLAPNQSTGVVTEISRRAIVNATGLVTVTTTIDGQAIDDNFPANDSRADDFIFVELCPYITP